jgi:hypothetical protein
MLSTSYNTKPHTLRWMACHGALCERQRVVGVRQHATPDDHSAREALGNVTLPGIEQQEYMQMVGLSTNGKNY